MSPGTPGIPRGWKRQEGFSLPPGLLEGVCSCHTPFRLSDSRAGTEETSVVSDTHSGVTCDHNLRSRTRLVNAGPCWGSSRCDGSFEVGFAGETRSLLPLGSAPLI